MVAAPAVALTGMCYGCLVLTLFLTTALAAEPVDPFAEADEAELFRAEEQVVTVASRYSQTIQQAPAIVTVLTDRDIRARGHRTLADLLRSLPGVYVSSSQEGRGLAWFRGVASPDNNKFLVLIDGVPLYDGVYTHAWIDDYLPLVDVKQVEVIKGPGSAVYGTNAFAGVVNVVTYRAADLDGGFARVEAGGLGRRSAAGVVADEVMVGDVPVEIRATARVLEVDGDGIDTNPEGERDVLGLAPRRAMMGRFGVSVAGLDVSWMVVDYRHTYLTQPQADPLAVLFQQADPFHLAYRDQLVSARWDVSLGDWGTVRPQLAWQSHDNPGQYAYLGDPSTTVDPDTGALSTELTGTLVETEKRSTRLTPSVDIAVHAVPAHTTLAGVGYDVLRIGVLEDREFVDFSDTPERPSSFAVRDPDARITDAFAWLQHSWTATYWLELTAGTRVDLHSAFGVFASPRAGVLLVPRDDLVVKVLYGRAFRAPTARELLVDVGVNEAGENLFVAGNPNLQPEVIDTVESEVTAAVAPSVRLRGAAFASAIGQEISSVVGNHPNLGTHFYDNGGTTSVLGGEAEVQAAPGPVKLDVTYSLTKAVDGASGRDQYGVPQHMVNAVLGVHPTDGLSLSLLADHVGARPRAEWTPASKRPDGAPVTLLHAAVASSLLADGRVRADLSVRNLLDTRYEDLVFRNDADAVIVDEQGNRQARYPRDIEAEGRAVTVAVEVDF